MKNVTVEEGLSLDRPASLLRRLTAWAAAVLMLASPATDAFAATGATSCYAATTPSVVASVPMTADPALFQWQGTEGASTYASSSYGNEEVVWQNAHREAQAALRILAAFGEDFGLSELDAYLDGVDGLLAAMPNRPTVEHARQLANGLRLARVNFVSDASTLQVWSKLVRAVDPESPRRRVPSRFVKTRVAADEVALGLSASESRVDRAVRAFFNSDADPAPAAS